MKSNNTNNNQKNNTIGNFFLIGLFLIGILGMVYLFMDNKEPSSEIELEQASLYDLEEEKEDKKTAYVSLK